MAKKYDPRLKSRVDGFSLPCMVTLSCGHKIRAQFKPRFSSSKYVCVAGQGCGYQLPWIAWNEGETFVENKEA